MATRPGTRRVNLTLRNELIASLDDLADAMERPRATVAAMLLEELRDTIPTMAKATRAAKDGDKRRFRTALRDLVGEAMADAMYATQPELFKGRK